MSQQPIINKVTNYIPSYWVIKAPPNGIQVTPNNEFLNYKVTSVKERNVYTHVSIENKLPTDGGSLLVFRIRVNKIEKTSEVKFALPNDITWRFSAGGYNYQTYVNGNFVTLAPSDIRPNGAWHTITLVWSPNSVNVLEDGIYKFKRDVSVGGFVNPGFDMQILDVGGSLDVDVGDIYAIPPKK